MVSSQRECRAAVTDHWEGNDMCDGETARAKARNKMAVPESHGNSLTLVAFRFVCQKGRGLDTKTTATSSTEAETIAVITAAITSWHLQSILYDLGCSPKSPIFPA